MQQPYFDDAEFAARRANVKAAMAKAGFDLLICADPANMDYLTGFKGWSFYVPQCVLVHADDEHPTWIGRGQDGAAARLTTTLPGITSSPTPTTTCRIARSIRWISWPTTSGSAA